MPKLPILCYHKVGPIAEEGRRLNIEPARLEEHVRFFKRRGFRFVLPGELDAAWPKRAVCFTFDDAYASTLERAPPIFEKNGVRCAFYAVTEKVGMTSDWDGELARPLATWEALFQAESQGFEIGNHTASHRRLTELTRAEQTLEIKAARDAFEQRGIACRSLCYPYGAWNQATIVASQECGYAVGLSLKGEGGMLALPRIAVACSDGIPKLLYKIHVRPMLP
ncbi:MAG: polysaccharide deacetylase family protein [Fimbriimonadaceae bacterium]